MAASDPKRREAVQAVLEELVAARDPLLPYVRGAGRLAGGGRASTDPVRLAHADLGRAIRRCRSRLAPTSGARYERKPTEDTGDAKTRRKTAESAYLSLRGTLNRAIGQKLPEVVHMHDENVRYYGCGDGLKGMSTYREETRDLVNELNALRAGVREGLGSYELIVAALKRDAQEAAEKGRGNAPAIRSAFLRHEERLTSFAARVADFEAASNALRAKLYREARRRRAMRVARKRPDWRYGMAEAAVGVFCEQHGRMPTKRECNELRELPPYTTLQRALGDNPLTKLRNAAP